MTLYVPSNSIILWSREYHGNPGGCRKDQESGNNKPPWWKVYSGSGDQGRKLVVSYQQCSPVHNYSEVISKVVGGFIPREASIELYPCCVSCRLCSGAWLWLIWGRGRLNCWLVMVLQRKNKRLQQEDALTACRLPSLHRSFCGTGASKNKEKLAKKEGKVAFSQSIITPVMLTININMTAKKNSLKLLQSQPFCNSNHSRLCIIRMRIRLDGQRAHLARGSHAFWFSIRARRSECSSHRHMGCIAHVGPTLVLIIHMGQLIPSVLRPTWAEVCLEWEHGGRWNSIIHDQKTRAIWTNPRIGQAMGASCVG